MPLTQMQRRKLAELGVEPRTVRLRSVRMAELPPAFLTEAQHWAHPSAYIRPAETWVDCPLVADKAGVLGVILPDGRWQYVGTD